MIKAYFMLLNTWVFLWKECTFGCIKQSKKNQSQQEPQLQEQTQQQKQHQKLQQQQDIHTLAYE